MARPPAGAARTVKDARLAPSALLGLGLVIAGCIVGISFFDRRTHPLLFVACTLLAGIAYLRSLWLLGRYGGGSNRVLALCLVLAAVWRVPLLLNPPTRSTDVYRYVWDGRVQRLGYDPYIVVPADSALRHLHTAETLLMNHPDVPTPYPPAAELFFRAVMTVDESARALKSAIFLCDAAIVAFLLCWLVSSNRSPWWVLAYAWNPLVALEGAGNGHVDLLGALCLVLTAASLARGKRTVAAVAFALAVGVKFVPVILAPLFWRRIRLRDVVIGVGILAALYLPFLGQGRVPVGSLGNYLAHWRSNAPIYSALEWIFPSAGLVGVPVGFGFAVALWARWHLPPDSPEAWAWPMATTLLFAPTFYPWYLLWVTPFLFTPSTLPLAVWTVSSLSIYWALPDWATTVVEYTPVLGVACWMWTQSVKAQRATTSASVSS
jgi:alpha-1,6-mannosyltransferase